MKIEELRKLPNFDETWSASDPYPTNPFTVVRPSELRKLAKARDTESKEKLLTNLDEALI
jgi:hypothetical protein